MNWAILIPIIAQYGLPLAEELYKRWSSGSVPTQADFDSLRVLANQSAADRMRAALAAAGIPSTDPKYVTLVQLAS